MKFWLHWGSWQNFHLLLRARISLWQLQMSEEVQCQHRNITCIQERGYAQSTCSILYATFQGQLSLPKGKTFFSVSGLRNCFKETGSCCLSCPHEWGMMNEHQIKYRKFNWNIKTFFFTVRILTHWNRLPRKVAESPFLEILKTQTKMVLSNLV